MNRIKTHEIINFRQTKVSRGGTISFIYPAHFTRAQRGGTLGGNVKHLFWGKQSTEKLNKVPSIQSRLFAAMLKPSLRNRPAKPYSMFNLYKKYFA